MSKLYKHMTLHEMEKTKHGVIHSFSWENRFLSNFHYCKVDYDGIYFPSVEHAFVYAKLRAFDRLDRNLTYKKFRLHEDGGSSREITFWDYNHLTPGKVKALGRSVHPEKKFLKRWDKSKYSVMQELVSIKFQNKNLADKLLETGKSILIEGNTWNDKIWGMCLVKGKYEGENWLGEILMNVRHSIKKARKETKMKLQPEPAKRAKKPTYEQESGRTKRPSTKQEYDDIPF